MRFEDAVPVVGFGSQRYLITRDGKAISRGPQSDLVLSPSIRRGGYRVVNLYEGGKVRSRPIHQLVLEAFVGPRPEGMTHTRHLNGISSDNRVENLAWGTPLRNALDRYDHGTHRPQRTRE